MPKPGNQKQRMNAPVDPKQKGLEAERDELIDASTVQDVTSTRAKSSRHKKMTADKANQ